MKVGDTVTRVQETPALGQWRDVMTIDEIDDNWIQCRQWTIDGWKYERFNPKTLSNVFGRKYGWLELTR